MAAFDTTDPKIIDLLNEKIAKKEPTFSFEYYPPRTDDGVKNLHARLDRMAVFKPLFADFTWGAGGSTSDLTLELTLATKKKGMIPNMHLTCTNMSPEKVDEALDGCKAQGVTNIVALRGDPPRGQEKWEAVEGGFECALDLVKHMRSKYGDYFGISVAGYPEGHPDTIKEVEGGFDVLSPEERARASVHKDDDGTERVYCCRDADFATEMKYLKEKCDAGADFIITQMFFDVTVYVSFVKACVAYGIKAPVVPGLMCINAYGGFMKMSMMCKTRVPEALFKGVEENKSTDASMKAFGMAEGVRMCQGLVAAGAPVLHFYTLNLETVPVGILTEMGMIKPADKVENADSDASTMTSAQGIL